MSNTKSRSKSKSSKNSKPSAELETEVTEMNSVDSDVAIDEDDALALAEAEADDEEEAVAAPIAAPGQKLTLKGEVDKRALDKGPRQAYFYCSANVTDLESDICLKDNLDNVIFHLSRGYSGIAQVPVKVTMPAKVKDPFDLKKAKAEAISSFTALFGMAPEVVSAATYPFKGQSKVKPSQPRNSIQASKLPPFIAKTGKAVHLVNDVPWIVKVQFTEDPRQVLALYDRPLNPSAAGDKKPQRPLPRGLWREHLTDVQVNESAPSN